MGDLEYIQLIEAEWHIYASLNQDRDFKIYVNEDLTTRRAILFAKMRTLQKKRLLKQAWTYNGNIKVMMPNGEIKNISNISSIQSLLPDVDISTVN